MSTQIFTKTIVQDEGTTVLSNDIINFTGSGVTVSSVGGAAQVYIPSPPTGLTYKGLWDATLNSPTLTSSVGIAGDFYIVGVAGTTNLNGITDWQISDWAIFEGGVWQKIDNHDIQAYNTVKDESTILPQRSVLKFEGTGVTALDAGGETVVTIPGNVSPTTYGLFAQTGNSTIITNTTVESSLINGGVGTITIPANVFSVGDSFRAVFGGIMNANNNQNIRIKVKAGSIVLLNSGLQNLGSSVINDVWSLNIDFTIRQTGIAGVASIVSLGAFHYTKTNNGSVQGFGFNVVNNTTFDTTISNVLDVTAQWQNASTGNNIYSDIFILNKTY
jgi:hypothetical protein